MARRLCQLLFTLACLYAAAVGVYAWLGYDGARPTVLEIAQDLHGWVRAKVAPKPAAPPAPGALPPQRPLPPVPPLPRETSPAPLPPPEPAPANDPRSRAIARVRDLLLPKAEEVIGKMNDPDAKVAALKVDARVILVEARDLLGPLIDENPTDKDAHRQYKRVAELLIAVDKR